MHKYVVYHAGFASLNSQKVGVTILVFSSNSSHLTIALLRGTSNNFQSSHLVAIQEISLENTQEHKAFIFTRGARYNRQTGNKLCGHMMLSMQSRYINSVFYGILLNI